ncbi:polyketide synthase dehydratase domain-containing protein [Streptomyces sp. M19]
MHSAPDDGPWTRHATGSLTAEEPGATVTATTDPTAWPTAGAEPVDLDGFYDTFAAGGIAYGPAFQGLTDAWRLGEEVLARVALPEEQRADARRFGIHPALLDALLQTVGLARAEARATPVLPFSFGGVRIHATDQAELRVRMTPRGEDEVSVAAYDAQGRPVVTVDSLVLRKLAGAPGTTRCTKWRGPPARCPTRCRGPTPNSPPSRRPPATRTAWSPAVLAASARTATERVLTEIQRWLATDHPADARLVVVTRRAVATAPDEDVLDLAAAPCGAGTGRAVRTPRRLRPHRHRRGQRTPGDGGPVLRRTPTGPA